jgi:hypothetical protein
MRDGISRYESTKKDTTDTTVHKGYKHIQFLGTHKKLIIHTRMLQDPSMNKELARIPETAWLADTERMSGKKDDISQIVSGRSVGGSLHTNVSTHH